MEVKGLEQNGGTYQHKGKISDAIRCRTPIAAQRFSLYSEETIVC